jgi:hypothetical protein
VWESGSCPGCGRCVDTASQRPTVAMTLWIRPKPGIAGAGRRRPEGPDHRTSSAGCRRSWERCQCVADRMSGWTCRRRSSRCWRVIAGCSRSAGGIGVTTGSRCFAGRGSAASVTCSRRTPSMATGRGRRLGVQRVMGTETPARRPPQSIAVLVVQRHLLALLCDVSRVGLEREP